MVEYFNLLRPFQFRILLQRFRHMFLQTGSGIGPNNSAVSIGSTG